MNHSPSVDRGMQTGPEAPTSPGGIVGDLAELVAAGQLFPTIYADPPWSYRNESSRAEASNHDRTLGLHEISTLPVAELAARNAHLHLWATTPLLEDALRVMATWRLVQISRFDCRPL